MLCPLCGTDVPDLRNGLCPSCGAAKRRFAEAPELVDVVRCAHCGRLERNGTWIVAPGTDEEIADMALQTQVDLDPELSLPHVNTEFTWEDPKNARTQVTVTGEYMGHPVQRDLELRIRLKLSSCNDCSRRYGGYFEAIVQIRGADERVLKAKSDAILKMINRDVNRYRDEHRTGAFISRSDRVKGGFDLYFGSQEVARLVAHDVADKYGAEYGESGKLVGRKDGNELFRFTLLVRLPPYLPGDYIELDGTAFKVLRHERKRLTLWHLERRERLQRDPRLVKNLKVIGRSEDEKEAIVVSHFGGKLQILDPDNMKTVDLELPPEEPIGETVRIFYHDEKFHIVPSPEAP